MKKLSLGFIAFLQATGVYTYCLLLGTLLNNGSALFGQQPNIMLPIAFLGLFVVSATICAMIFLGYPFILVWDQKQTKKAIKLVLCSTAWLAGYVVSTLGYLILNK